MNILIKKLSYLEISSRSISDRVFYFFFRVGTWILIFTNLVPISLLVTLEMVKYIQGIFISWDYKLYSNNDLDSGCKVQTSTLNEELGQVKVLFKGC
jgi:phospholipid-transporting ATPase